jgi:hypothetical protein
MLLLLLLLQLLLLSKSGLLGRPASLGGYTL